MTDRRSFLIVSLKQDMRDDDCDAVVNAILQLRDVAGVTRGEPVNGSEIVARARIKLAVMDKMIKLLDEPI